MEMRNLESKKEALERSSGKEALERSSGKEVLERSSGKARIDVSKKGKEDDDAMVIAIMNKMPISKLRELLDAGHNINGFASLEYMDGGTPLHAAVKVGSHEIGDWLLDNGAQIDIKCKLSGGTPLHWTAEHQRIVMADLLIKRAEKMGVALIDQTDTDGETALHWARNGLGMTKFLVKAGANVKAEDDQHITPFQRAIRVRAEKVVLWYMKKMSEDDLKLYFSSEEKSNSDLIELIKNVQKVASSCSILVFDLTVVQGMKENGYTLMTFLSLTQNQKNIRPKKRK